MAGAIDAASRRAQSSASADERAVRRDERVVEALLDIDVDAVDARDRGRVGRRL